jgi:hypothetical protein
LRIDCEELYKATYTTAKNIAQESVQNPLLSHLNREFKGSSGWLNQCQEKHGINHTVISRIEDDATKCVAYLWKERPKQILKYEFYPAGKNSTPLQINAQ